MTLQLVSRQFHTVLVILYHSAKWLA